MPSKRKFVVAFSGLDPSGGAGLLADIKTFEANKVYGLGVSTALTAQNESSFISCEWVKIDKILEQAKPILEKYKPNIIKVGIVSSIEMLSAIINYCNKIIPSSKIVLDPVLSSSSGFNFNVDGKLLRSELKSIYLLTPNWNEAKLISGNNNAIEGAKELSSYCPVFLKGGHTDTDFEIGRDYLIKNGIVNSFKSKTGTYYAKHGSGCVLASAIASNLAKGYDLHRACLRGKSYAGKFLKSNQSLLGYHLT
jgi:hydroxymethylpyrimidine/phosphomethylpyrimidine kinase